MKEVFEQAYNDRLGVKIITPDSVSVIYRGVKIQNKNDNIKIYNLAKGGDFYKEATLEQYDVFLQKGFRGGVYEICMENYKRTLDTLSIKIRNEMQSRKNVKHYDSLKEWRTTIMNKITEIINLKTAV